uniref:Zinc finger HIT-type containing 3 n=2 Tax=Podarcis muralis TaxID=64176 RepID=A0A670JMV3_PODMU
MDAGAGGAAYRWDRPLCWLGLVPDPRRPGRRRTWEFFPSRDRAAASTMQSPGCSRVCVVCGEGGRGGAKYRCPGCRERYCSVSCCKKHKEQCAPKAEPRPQPTSQETSQRTASMNDEGRSWSVDDILTEDDEDDKVPLQKLRLLGESEELKGLLLNPHLGQLLLTVDQAKDKSAILKTYMQEPLFVEFADCCLRIVEPPEKENTRPE